MSSKGRQQPLGSSDLTDWYEPLKRFVDAPSSGLAYLGMRAGALNSCPLPLGSMPMPFRPAGGLEGAVEEVCQGTPFRAPRRLRISIRPTSTITPFDFPGLTEGQGVRSEDRVFGSARMLKTCADGRLVASGFEK
jgi:hypothetical protein